jgi:hypothetical protein
MSAAYESVEPTPAPVVAGTQQSTVRTGSLATMGLLTLLVSAWGGVVPYLGPSFGYSADGASSWVWNLSHAVLGLAPGVVGVVVGLAMLSSAGRLRFGTRRLSVATAGLLGIAAGGWFVIGPAAWPVIDNTHQYFVGAASPLRLLANVVGYSLGTGLIVAVGGAFALGFSMRHQRRLMMAPTPVTGPRHGLRLHRSPRPAPAATTTAT